MGIARTGVAYDDSTRDLGPRPRTAAGRPPAGRALEVVEKLLTDDLLKRWVLDLAGGKVRTGFQWT